MKYFNRKEFECKCGCGLDTVDFELVEVLDSLREHYNQPITITSGCRCFLKNHSVNGADQSQHMTGRAADIQVYGVDPPEVALYLNSIYPDKYGIGTYTQWTHIDTRDGKARWDKR